MKSRGYWTYDRCKEVVKKYKTKKDLYTNDGSVYVTITRNKWFDLIDNLNISENDIFKRLIYSYEFSDNSCYVGLTFNIKKRNKQHLSGNGNSSVYKHIKKTGLIPKLIIKSEIMNMSDAINMENFILDKKRGVSLSIFKNKELCKIESMKYSKRTHFQNGNKSAYNNAWRNGWLDEFYPKIK
jgi:predicted GIY-YIG superfamily endonuclease